MGSLRSHLFKLISCGLLPLSGVLCTGQSAAELRIGMNVWPGYDPLHLAAKKEFYGDSHIKLIEFGSATEVIRAFRNGIIEGAAVTLDDAIILKSEGFAFKIILVLNESTGGDAILGQKEFHFIRQLKGRRIGVENSALGAYILARALEKNRLRPNEITPVTVELAEHESYFAKHKIDAVVTSEPIRMKLLKHGATVLFDSQQLPGEIFSVLILKDESLEKNTEQAASLLHGWFRALEYLRNEPDRAIAIMAAHEGIDAGDFRKSLDGIHFSGREENRKYFNHRSAAITIMTRKMANKMVAIDLLSHAPDVEALYMTEWINGGRP